MAYNAVSQADLEVASNASNSDASRSPSPKMHDHGFQQLPLDSDHTGGSYLPARTTENSSMSGLGSLIRSVTSTSYEMVEGDDYSVSASQVSANRKLRPSSKTTSLRRICPPETGIQLASSASPEDEPPLRTPISDTPVPLSHPIPDLQSLQGAYLGNVERLERSAERMSCTSTDIESEIRKLDLEQKRRSCGSFSNSVGASNHSGMSFSGNVSPPYSYSAQSVTRLRSGSGARLEQVSEQGHEFDEHYEHDAYSPSAAHIFPPPPPAHQYDSVPCDGPSDLGHDGYGLERTASAASGDTYQQAKVLFTDFDGVHYVPQDRESDIVRQGTLTRPSAGSASGSYNAPQNGSTVYYPAPVPRMLNLPPRLSQKPVLEREKRRTQLLGAISNEDNNVRDHASDKARKRSTMPPQLRANVFFEQPSTSLDLEANQASAVATLDSILDASAHAPVTAFTDHPFAGHLGSGAYGTSSHNARGNTLTSGHLLETEADVAEAHEGAALRSDVDEQHVNEEGGHVHGEDLSNYTGPPNTLMAELELRKHEHQQRRRTAANTYGLHSTLLQLDAVAQKQSEHRRQRPVTLAWEGPANHKHESEDDDDVPLAVLFPDKANLPDDARPLGLIEKKHFEENEPLSKRRARLRGEAPPVQPPSVTRRPQTMYSQAISAPAEVDSGDEGETLGQRLKRLRAQEQASTAAQSDFASEVLAEFQNMHREEKEQGEAAREETLGQRRARLQQETKNLRSNTHARTPTARRSMMDISQILTATAGRSHHPAAAQRGLVQNRMSMYQNSNLGHAPPVGYPQYPEYATQNHGQGAHPTTNTFYSDAVLGMNHLSYATPNSVHAKLARPANTIEPGQREIIDRWRQSVR